MSRLVIELLLNQEFHAGGTILIPTFTARRATAYCHSCDYCRSGKYNLCPDTVFAATPPHDGTLTKYFVVASDYCYKVPDHLDMEQAALFEPVAAAVQIVRNGNVRGNQTVVVFGCGPIGVLCQAICRTWGCKTVIGVDIVQSRLDFASSFSGGDADSVYMSPKRPAGVESMEWSEKTAKMIKEKFGLGDGPDVVLEATGAESCIQTGIHLCKPGGIFVQAGMGVEVRSFHLETVIPRSGL